MHVASILSIEKGPHLNFGFSEGLSPGALVRLQSADSGCGMRQPNAANTSALQCKPWQCAQSKYYGWSSDCEFLDGECTDCFEDISKAYLLAQLKDRAQPQPAMVETALKLAEEPKADVDRYDRLREMPAIKAIVLASPVLACLMINGGPHVR